MNRSHTFRWAAIVGGVLALLVVVILAAPFLLDFNRFKPMIKQAVAGAVQADVDFASARLQLFPRIGIKLTKVKVTNTDADFKGTQLFAVDSALVDAKLIPLFSGMIRGEVIIDSPEFTLARKGLKNNLTSLARPATPGSPEQPADTGQPTAAPQDSPSQAKMFAMIKEKVLIEAVRITDASITIRNVSSTQATPIGNEPVQITHLDIELLDIGLERDIHARVTTEAAVAQAGAKVAGRMVFDNTIRIAMGESGLKDVAFNGKLNLDNLDINFRDAFVKKSGIPLNASYKGQLTTNSFVLERLDFVVHTLVLKANAQVDDFTALNIKVGAMIDDKDLASLGDLLPQHKKLLSQGSIGLAATAEGMASKPETIKANVAFATKLAGTDLSLKLDASSAFPFKGTLAISSQRIDVDALLKPFLKDKKPEVAAAAPPIPATPPVAAAPVAPPKDFELSPEVKTLLKGTDGTVRVDIREVTCADQSLTNIVVNATLKDLQAKLGQFGIDGFGGTIRANGDLDLGKNPISFRGDFRLNNVQPELIMALIKPEQKNLLKGRMNVELAANGSGTTMPTLNKTLNGKGTFRFLDGELHSASVSQLVQTKYDEFATSTMKGNVAKSAFDAAKRLIDSPLVKAAGKTPPNLDKIKSDIDSAAQLDIAGKGSSNKGLKDVSGTIEIKNGRIYVNTVNTSDTGTWNVASNVGLDMSLGGGAIWTASAATKQTMLARSKYASVLFNDKGEVVINSTLSGTVMDPKVALTVDQLKANLTKRLSSDADKDLRQAAEQYLKSLTGKDTKQLQKEAEKALNDLLGGKKPAQKDAGKKSKEQEAKDKLKNALGQ